MFFFLGLGNKHYRNTALSRSMISCDVSASGTPENAKLQKRTFDTEQSMTLGTMLFRGAKASMILLQQFSGLSSVRPGRRLQLRSWEAGGVASADLADAVARCAIKRASSHTQAIYSDQSLPMYLQYRREHPEPGGR
jgi:hypothetical protein